jgi:hypothetical protein
MPKQSMPTMARMINHTSLTLYVSRYLRITFLGASGLSIARYLPDLTSGC